MKYNELNYHGMFMIAPMTYFGSTTQYNMNRKTIRYRFILAVSAEHRRHNNTLYNNFYYIQICGVRTRTDRAERQFTQNTVRTEARKNLPEKTSIRKKKLGRKSG